MSLHPPAQPYHPNNTQMENYKQTFLISVTGDFLEGHTCTSIGAEIETRLQALCEIEGWTKPTTLWKGEERMRDALFGVGSRFTRDDEEYLLVEAIGHFNLFNIATGNPYFGIMPTSLQDFANQLHNHREAFVLSHILKEGATVAWNGDTAG